MQKRTKQRILYDLSNFGATRFPQFGHYKYTQAKPGLEPHLHHGIMEICYLMGGKQVYAIGERNLELKGNDLVIIDADTAHSTGNFPEDIGELYWLQVHLSPKKGRLCHLPQSESDRLIEALRAVAHTVIKGSFALKPILNKLEVRLASRNDALSSTVVNQLLLQLLVETLEISSNQGTSVVENRLGTIDKFIETNLDRPIFVDELAAIAGLSVAYFKEWFKKQQGIPPKEYVNRARIHKAKAQLLSKPSVTQVAFDLGFASSQYFATSFKKHTGLSPMGYLAKMKGPEKTKK